MNSWTKTLTVFVMSNSGFTAYKVRHIRSYKVRIYGIFTFNIKSIKRIWIFQLSYSQINSYLTTNYFQNIDLICCTWTFQVLAYHLQGDCSSNCAANQISSLKYTQQKRGEFSQTKDYSTENQSDILLKFCTNTLFHISSQTKGSPLRDHLSLFAIYIKYIYI